MKKKTSFHWLARSAPPLLLTLGAIGLAHARIGPDISYKAGVTTPGTTPSGGLSANFKRGSRFTLSQAGTISDL